MKLRLIMSAVILFAAVPYALPQGKGRQGGKGQAGQAQGQQRGSGSTGGERDRVRVSQKQRDQLTACDRSADAVRDQARQMGRYGQKDGFNAGQARQDRDRLLEQVRAMQQEHQSLVKGLNPGQQQALESHIRNMNRLQERLNLRMQNLNGELGKSNPDAKQVAKHAREMERISNEWRGQHRSMQKKLLVDQ